MCAYPQEVRRRYAEEMVSYFGDLSQEEWLSRGPKGLALLWARTLPELLFTALKERSALLQRNAYLPVAPRMMARLGALCALLGGSLGMACILALFLSPMGRWYVATNSWPFTEESPIAGTLSSDILFAATLVSCSAMFGLYGTLVAQASRGQPRRLVGAGSALAALSAVSLLVMKGYQFAERLGWLWSPEGGYYWWEMHRHTILFAVGLCSCVVGLTLLGVSAFRTRLFVVGPWRALPFVVGTLWPASIALTIVLNVAQIRYYPLFFGNLPFLSSALLGWVLLKHQPTHRLAAAGAATSGTLRGVAEETRGTGRLGKLTRALRRSKGQGWMGRGRQATAKPSEAAAKEKELLEVIRRKGGVTVVEAAIEASLSVEEADRILSALAVRGHLEVHVDGARIIYSLWESLG
jgi:hypothetical protein